MNLHELFEGQELSEDFKNKVQEMFVAAVEEAVKAKEQSLAEQFDIQKATLVAEHKDQVSEVRTVAEKYRADVVAEYAGKIKEVSEQYDQKLEDFMTTEAAKIDEFLKYVSEKWLEENRLAVEHGVRADMVESFLTGLHGLFKEHYIEVPEDKVDVVAKLTAEHEEISEKLNNSIAENVELKTFIRGKAKEALVSEVASGLAETQIERLNKIAEGLEFTDEESFKSKLNTIRESIVAESVNTGSKETQKNTTLVTSLTEGFEKRPEMGELASMLAAYGTKK